MGVNSTSEKVIDFLKIFRPVYSVPTGHAMYVTVQNTWVLEFATSTTNFEQFWLWGICRSENAK